MKSLVIEVPDNVEIEMVRRVLTTAVAEGLVHVAEPIALWAINERYVKHVMEAGLKRFITLVKEKYPLLKEVTFTVDQDHYSDDEGGTGVSYSAEVVIENLGNEEVHDAMTDDLQELLEEASENDHEFYQGIYEAFEGESWDLDLTTNRPDVPWGKLYLTSG
jgi:hypothetical protein